jgi:hypothetical protein
MYLNFLKLFTLLNLHCKYNYLDQLPFDCKLRRMYLSILIKTIIIIIIIITSGNSNHIFLYFTLNIECLYVSPT